MIVLDASAFLDSVLHESAAQALEVIAENSAITVPDYFYIEVINGLRQLDRLNHLTSMQLHVTLDLIPQLPFMQISTVAMTKEIWVLRNNVSSYDAGYVALAQNLSASLITHDKRLAKAIANLVAVQRLMP